MKLVVTAVLVMQFLALSSAYSQTLPSGDRQRQIFKKELALMDDNTLLQQLGKNETGPLSSEEFKQTATTIIRDRLARLAPDAETRLLFLRFLYTLYPADAGIGTQLAWACYNRKDYGCAQKLFSDLNADDPDNPEIILGLGYSLKQSDHTDAAIALVSGYANPENEKIQILYLDLLKESGLAAYRAQYYDQAENYLDRAAKLDPGDDGIAELLEWARYHQGKPEGLIRLLKDRYKSAGSLKSASDLIVVLEATRHTEQLKDFIRQLVRENKKDTRHLVGRYYRRTMGPVTAAQFDPAQGTCYEGCADPKLWTGPFLSEREGDDGLSRLSVTGLTLNAEMTIPTSQIWGFRFSALDLSTGSAGSNPYAGSFFGYIADPDITQRDMAESRTVYSGQLFFENENQPHWSLSVGTTPQNGISPARPTFDIAYQASAWTIKAEQSEIKDSFLSWIGQKDPYSEHTWGRVLKTGLTAEFNTDLAVPYWFSLAGRLHRYQGENVQDNLGGGLSASLGRTDDGNKFSRHMGLFTDITAFRDNHNFYTYGHGGYYSPRFEWVCGPFMRLTHKPCRDYWLDIEVSLGASYRQTEDAPHYRDPDTTNLSAGFLNNPDLTGTYDGDSGFDASFSLDVSGLRHLGRNWFLGGQAGFTNTTGFRKFDAGLFLKHHFSNGNSRSLCEPRRFIDNFMSAVR